MFKRAVRIARVSGIDIKLHWSLLLIFTLIAVQLGFGVFPSWHPEWGPVLTWTVAVGAAGIFFASVIAHELAHALTAQVLNVPVRDITLFLFGGIAGLEEDPERAWHEAVIALAGPLLSLLLGVGFIFLASLSFPQAAEPLTQQTSAEEALARLEQLGPLATALLWVGPINLILAAFNMLPAFPLDGGRVMRALLWGGMRDRDRGTRWAVMLSRLISWGLIAAGIAMALGFEVPLFGSGVAGGLWLAVIGWFVGRAAQATLIRTLASQALEGISIGELTQRDLEGVDASMSVEDFVEQFFARAGDEAIPVLDDGGDFVGLVELEHVREVDRSRWDRVRVEQIMRPRAELDEVRADESAEEVFERMMRRGDTTCAVTEDGRVLGVLHQRDLLHWLRLHLSDREMALGV